MATTTGLLTADELLWMPDDDLFHELVRGRLTTMPPPGPVHGVCGGRLGTALTLYVTRRHLGLVMQGGGFKLASDPDTVRAPDVSFVHRDRLPHGELPIGYPDGAPDLAVEVLSARDRRREVDQKVREYLAAGAQVVWIVDPRTRTVSIHRLGESCVTLGGRDSLGDERLLPGFKFSLSELFENLARK